MKIIKMLSEQILDEAEGAAQYAKLAIQYKDEDKVLADNYAKMAEVELQHVDLLHAQAVRIIKAWEAKGNTAPPEMSVIWQWEHSKAIDNIARVRVMLNMYAGR